MPHIYDNIELKFLPTLVDGLKSARSADFCVGYFNLRGWNELGEVIEERFEGGEGNACRLLVGMPTAPEEELRRAYSLLNDPGMDAGQAIQLKKAMARKFQEQLVIGAPTDRDERNLQRLARQLRAGKVVMKLFLRRNLHAKLYLVHREDKAAPIVGYVGSSNLTFAGLTHQFELNVDVLDSDATQKLSRWFDERWNDRWSLDISQELAAIIEASWARPTAIPPYHIYLKIAYHLSREARAGLSEFSIPADFGNRLFDYQVAAVKIAAHHLNNDRRRGVMLGDVVGLGKTLMATALARIFEDDYGMETLIVCPKNLEAMWEGYKHRYRLRAHILPTSLMTSKGGRGLADLRRYRIVIIDESHNLRNREGQRYRALQEYIASNECRCILLSATPYNKTYLDLGAQLRLFVPESHDLGIRPEHLLREIDEVKFQAKYQCPVRSLAAFEKSTIPDDWRDLMRLYMVRRTRGFIKENYARLDEESGRRYLTLDSGERSYFPVRIPITVRFPNDISTDDPYAHLFSTDTRSTIGTLALPRYGLGNYVLDHPSPPPNPTEAKVIADLSRAGRRLMGFCRTNLFKRLESSGLAFIQSLERHALRNYLYLHAIAEGLPVPIGTTDPGALDTEQTDRDVDDPAANGSAFDLEDDDDDAAEDVPVDASVYVPLSTEAEFRERARQVYARYSGRYKSRFKWLRPHLFARSLIEDLMGDANQIRDILAEHGTWTPSRDCKLQTLFELLTQKHPGDKVLVFTQFADTVHYLATELKKMGVRNLEGVTGGSHDVTGLIDRFSPVSNDKRGAVSVEMELRVLIATDVLSEGQNLQDAHVVVNFDLPWAIVRLIQRAGRVDRIGQHHAQIFCYSFYPMDNVEEIINLGGRVQKRLTENAEVVGADERFFEDQVVDERHRDLYNEKSGVLDDDGDAEVDLSSQALQIWKNATDGNPGLKATIEALPDVVYTAREHTASAERPNGALVYMRTADDNDALAWVNEAGEPVTESPLAILRAAACRPDTPAAERAPNHHEIVRMGVERMVAEESRVGGQLGKPSGARYRIYQRLKAHADRVQRTVFASDELNRVIEEIYRFPLRQVAVDTLNRQMKAGASDEALADLTIELRADGRLCLVEDEQEVKEPRIICSLGLVGGAE